MANVFVPISPTFTNYAMYFNGTDSYVVVPNFNGSDNMTFVVWLFDASTPNERKYGNAIIDWGDPWNTNGLGVLIDYGYGGNTYRVITSNNQFSDYAIPLSYTLNKWGMIALSISNTDKKWIAYADAVPTFTKDITGFQPANGQNLYIGEVPPGVLYEAPNGGHWHGYIAQILIYNRALSQAEIERLYATPTNPIKDGLVLWLQADPSTVKGNVWFDKSGNNNNGVIFNAQLVPLSPTVPQIPLFWIGVGAITAVAVGAGLWIAHSKGLI